CQQCRPVTTLGLPGRASNETGEHHPPPPPPPPPHINLYAEAVQDGAVLELRLADPVPRRVPWLRWVFRCPACTAERQALCLPPTDTCAEIVREPGCGCCPVCARQEGDLCGVYTPRCSGGLACYPQPDSELPLEQLGAGPGVCGHQVDPEPPLGAWMRRKHSSSSSSGQ
ncbi:hypothetical protein CRUP_018942, partial [Coryphaenoides rupestris]